MITNSEMGIVLAGSDLGYKIPTDLELRALFGQISIPAVAPILGRISTALQLEAIVEPLQRRLAQMFLSVEVQRSLFLREEEERVRGARALWVTSDDLRIVIKLLLENGSNTGGNGMDDPTVRQIIGVAILSVQELYRSKVDLGPVPRGSHEWLHTLLKLTQCGSIASPRPLHALSHKETVYLEVFQDGDLRDRFEQHFGVRPEEIHRGLVALWVVFSRMDTEMLKYSAEHSVDFRMLFGRFNVRQSVGDLILQRLAIDLRKEPPAKNGRESEYDAGITFLVKQPIGRTDDNLVCCLDIDFLHSAYARLIFNLTLELLKGDEKVAVQLVHQVGGRVLEETARTAFETIRRERTPRRATVFAPWKGAGLEVDALIVEDREVVLFEMKAGMLPPNLTHGTSTSALAAEIDSRYVKTNRQGNRKGFSQLAEACRRVLKDPSLVGLDRIKYIHPVLVVEDDTIPFKPTILYVLAEAQSVLHGIGHQVQRPIVLHAEDLMLLAERSRKYGVPYMMRRMWRDGFRDMAFRDSILRLQVSSTEAVQVQRRFPITEQVFDELAAWAPEWADWTCTVCGGLGRLGWEKDQTRVYVCTVCYATERVPAEVLEAEKRAHDDWVGRYLSS